MSSKKKRNDVGSGPGENIDIEDKINAAMDKIMKDPEEERNSSKRKYEPDNGESETEEYESEERYDSEEYESDEAYDSEEEYESEEDYDPEEEYGSQEEHGEDAEYDEEGYDEPEEEGSQDFSRNIKASGKLKSARPQPVKYVPMDDIEEKLALLPENKRKKHKGLKITRPSGVSKTRLCSWEKESGLQRRFSFRYMCSRIPFFSSPGVLCGIR